MGQHRAGAHVARAARNDPFGAGDGLVGGLHPAAGFLLQLALAGLGDEVRRAVLRQDGAVGLAGSVLIRGAGQRRHQQGTGQHAGSGKMAQDALRGGTVAAGAHGLVPLSDAEMSECAVSKVVLSRPRAT